MPCNPYVLLVGEGIFRLVWNRCNFSISYLSFPKLLKLGCSVGSVAAVSLICDGLAHAELEKRRFPLLFFTL